MNTTTTDETRHGVLRLSSRNIGTTHTIELAGELDLANVDAFQTVLRDARSSGAAAIIIDLEALEFIDSSGIACLVYAHQELNEEGDGPGCLRLVPSRAMAVRRVIEATGLDTRLLFIKGGPPA